MTLEASASWPLGFPPENWARMSEENTHNPRGERLTLARVGELYLEWYAQERCDVEAAKRQADAHNAEIDRHNEAVDDRVGQGRKPQVATKSLRRHPRKHWLDFAKPSVKKRFREHERYFGEFVRFTREAFGEINICLNLKESNPEWLSTANRWSPKPKMS